MEYNNEIERLNDFFYCQIKKLEINNKYILCDNGTLKKLIYRQITVDILDRRK